MTTLVVMQPTYLPWLGYFDLMRRADKFVVYDSAQFSKQSWQQRNRVRDRRGEIMLTVPVLTKGLLGQTIREVAVNGSENFVKKHLDTIRFNYAKTPHFQELFPALEEIYSKKHAKLMDLNLELIEIGRRWFKIETPLIFSSSLDVKGQEVDALIDLCRKTKADHYLSPEGARGYIEANNLFEKEGIRLTFQEFQHPVYKQLNYPDFISHLSFIDFIFNSDVRDFNHA